MTRRKLKLGDLVRVYEAHWLRGGEVGEVVGQDNERGEHRYLIQFPTKKIGKGLDGDKIWLTELCVSIEQK